MAFRFLPVLLVVSGLHLCDIFNYFICFMFLQSIKYTTQIGEYCFIVSLKLIFHWQLMIICNKWQLNTFIIKNIIIMKTKTNLIIVILFTISFSVFSQSKTKIMKELKDFALIPEGKVRVEKNTFILLPMFQTLFRKNGFLMFGEI